MMPALEKATTPGWLQELGSRPALVDERPIPIEKVLTDSLYYPSSRLDGTMVRTFGGNVVSFVYCDYGVETTSLLMQLDQRGFRGYTLLAARGFKLSMLAVGDWRPIRPAPEDGNIGFLRTRRRRCAEVAHWSIWRRRARFPPDHGPELFSFLFVLAEACEAYTELYCRRGVFPLILALVQPGHRMGGNWTDFTDPTGFFARCVRSHRVGLPRYLVHGGYEARSIRRQYPPSAYSFVCWPDYRQFLGWVMINNHRMIGLWSR